MALWLHPSQSRGSPHRQAGGETDLLLAAQKLFLVEGSPKHWEFWPRAVYFLYFCTFHLWFRGIQAQLEPLPFTCQSPAQPHQDPLPRDTCPKTPQGQRALPCTSSLHQAMLRASREMPVGYKTPLPIPDAYPRAILAGETISHSSQMLSCPGKMRVR